MARETITKEDHALLGELGVEPKVMETTSYTSSEERIIAGFEEIQHFVKAHGHPPRHGEDRDIFERIYSTRLECIRKQEECRTLLVEVDYQGLLTDSVEAQCHEPDELDDDALLAELGVGNVDLPITKLDHVRSTAEKQAAEEIASRRQCEDFENFQALFEQVQCDLDTGLRETRPFQQNADIEAGQYFILGGQKVYVAERGETFIKQYSDNVTRKDARMRVIFDNGTESDLLMRSLQRALYKDDSGRRIIDSADVPLFADQAEADDEASGTIYVLRSKSNNPFIQENRDLIHKIGVTNKKVETRIANAKLDPTFLMADVEVVATYQLYNINRSKLENLIHRIFAKARLELEIKDRFGNPVVPREWFLVPLDVIDEAVKKIQEGTIARYFYDMKKASLVEG